MPHKKIHMSKKHFNFKCFFFWNKREPGELFFSILSQRYRSRSSSANHAIWLRLCNIYVMRIVAALRCQHTGAIGTRRIYDSWETYRPYPPPTVSSTQLEKTTTHHVVPGMWPMRAVSSPERRYRTWIRQQKIEFFGSHPSITGVPYRLILSLYRSDVARRSNAKEILRWTTSRVFVPFYSCAEWIWLASEWQSQSSTQ